MEELLKLGTVVRLDDSPVELMIVGYFPRDKNTETAFTYTGINADLGISFREEAVYFNLDSVKEIVFDGYSDAEGDEFRLALAVLLNEQFKQLDSE